jgi:nicotinic acid phosphoribosyltransferase
MIGMRLDSGDLLDQALYALRRLQKEDMLDPRYDKIVIADISDSEKIKEIEETVRLAGFDPEKFIAYGLGGLLVAKNKTRDAVSAGLKLTDTENFATGKQSNDTGKNTISGTLNIEIRENERVIVQETEEIK